MAQSFKNIWENIATILRRPFIRKGLPFFIFVAGGSFFLKEFTTIRYDFRQGRQLSKEEAEKLGLVFKDTKTVKEEMLKEIEQMNLDNWVNIRGPRPWEDSKTVQDEQRERLQATTEGTR